MGDLALNRKITDVISEYDEKITNAKKAVADFEAAGAALRMAACVGGTFGNTHLETGRIYDTQVIESLLKSAWLHIYNGLQIERIASPSDKRRFEQSMAKPAPFTLENIRATFGRYIEDPRGNILRGLAEVFCDLDPFYKSHDKVKIGVAGLPKRVILPSVGGWGSWGKDKLESVLNALATYQGKPLVTWPELQALLKNETALLHDWEVADGASVKKYPGRGVTLKLFKNGNGHLIFEPETLRDINLALAEFYGDVLADCEGDDDAQAPRASTALAKDLQYYPTPQAIVERVLNDCGDIRGQKILEPSCGCGRFLDEIRKRGGDALGFEVSDERWNQCFRKGHSVIRGNFLDATPTDGFDWVIMNPPFYGRHYAKHVQHALKFLKPGGFLKAILPATARYDHGLLDGRWEDLPVGAFSESGTNICTTILTIRKPEK